MKQDNTILYNLVERSELPLNPETYSSECCNVSGFKGSLMEYIIEETERSHAMAGRYKRQPELPFSEMVLEPVLPRFESSDVLHPFAVKINFNKVIWDVYFKKMLPKLAKSGSNGDNGLCAVCDTKILQALSRRVHYSMFFAEAKFREAPELFEAAIKEQNADKLRELLTCSEMEESKLRLKNRTETFGSLVNQGKPFILKLELSAKLFDTYIVPILIEVQVHYLLWKGKDANSASSAVRNLIRIRALSKAEQALVKVWPSLAYVAKLIGILTLALLVGAKDKILEFLESKGLAPNKSTMALMLLCSLSVKGAYVALKEGKEAADLAKYYAKLLEKDKKDKKDKKEK